MGVTGFWDLLMGSTKTKAPRFVVPVGGKRVALELYGLLHNVLDSSDAGQDEAVVANIIAHVSHSEALLAESIELLENVALKVVSLLVSLFELQKVSKLHIVLEGVHPGKGATHKKRSAYLRPPDCLTKRIVNLLTPHPRFSDVTLWTPPHDADSQLAYLGAAGICDFVFVPSCDADMMLFEGLKDKLVYAPKWSAKSDKIWGVIYRGYVGSGKDLTIPMARTAAILIGCDYFKVPGYGPKRALELVRKVWDTKKPVLQNLCIVEGALKDYSKPGSVQPEWLATTMEEAYHCFASQLVVDLDGKTRMVDTTRISDPPKFMLSGQDLSGGDIMSYIHYGESGCPTCMLEPVTTTTTTTTSISTSTSTSTAIDSSEDASTNNGSNSSTPGIDGIDTVGLLVQWLGFLVFMKLADVCQSSKGG